MRGRPSAGLLILFFALWGNAMISLSFLLATFFSQTRSASIVGYLLAIVGVGVANLLNISVFLAARPPAWSGGGDARARARA